MHPPILLNSGMEASRQGAYHVLEEAAIALKADA
jgi:hypothetical protein